MTSIISQKPFITHTLPRWLMYISIYVLFYYPSSLYRILSLSLSLSLSPLIHSLIASSISGDDFYRSFTSGLKMMNPTSVLISRRILQSNDIDAFNGIPETSLSPLSSAVDPNTSASAARRLLDPTAPFDSSMALTVLILLTALFFLAFFSVYIRRSSAVAAADIASPPNPPKRDGGLDRSAVSSLPLVAYGRAANAKHPMIDGCPICLSEFSEGETVKLIPYCGHVFHPSCIDTWLASRVTCPLCRSAELFDRVEEVCLDVAPDKTRARAPELGERSTAENCDAWRQRGSDGVRRTRSCSNLAKRAVLQRSTSF